MDAGRDPHTARVAQLLKVAEKTVYTMAQKGFPGWQQTSAGEREVKKALRKTLFKYKLHADTELFEKAYGYIKQYY